MNSSLDKLCLQISSGRRMARLLAAELRGQPLSEAEFRLLWLIARQGTNGIAANLQQRQLAARLGLSQAQVSTLVEKLGCRKVIRPILEDKDRRRQHWRLTPTGGKLFAEVARVIETSCTGWIHAATIDSAARTPREEAA